MVHFVLGSSGTGKTAYVTNFLADLCRKGNSNLLMLVPDQSSFETENDFLDILGPKLSRNVTVFGFSRLSNYVFTETGNIHQNVIDDGVRNIIMSMALDEVEDKLEMFNKKNTRKSILDLMVHSLKECKKDNITTQMLRNTAEVINDETLNYKLLETALVLDAYEALVSQTYIDPLDNLNRLKNILTDSNMFNDYTIVVDSFSGFTYQQLEIIEILMNRSKDFYITLNLDMENKHSEVFATTYRTYKAIKHIAKRNSLEISPKTILNKHYRFKNQDLRFLESNIFKFDYSKYSEKAENVEIFGADNFYGEADYIASKIKQLVVEEGYSYKDIAVVARDSNKYAGILDIAFQKYDIPYFMDIPQDIYTRPVVRLISCGIDCVIQRFDREQLLSMMKTGLLPLTETEIAEFENYLYIWNIEGKDLKKPFGSNPSGFESMSESDEEKLAEIEKIRQYVVTPLAEFAESCKNANGLDISKALYRLLTAYDVQKSLDNLFETDDEEMLLEAKEEVRVYNSIIETLEKLVAVAGEKQLSLKKYKEYLDFKVSDITLSSIPRFQDQVSVGTADRVRLNEPKAVFLIGAIDGEFPSIPKTAGVFTENERRLLVDNSLPLTDSLEELACHEKYLVYCAITSSTEKVYVTSYSSDYSGNQYSPSVIVTELAEIFPNNRIYSSVDYNEYNSLWSEKKAFECLAKNFTDNSPQTMALRNYFEDKDGYRDIVENMESALEHKPFKLENKSVIEKLFTKNIHISASQLETYNLCAFQYFCKYGLRAKERRTASIDAMEFGNIVHYFLEEFLQKYSKSALNEISDKEIKFSIDAILLNYANENFGGLSDKAPSFIYLFNRLKDNIFNLIKQIIRQLQYSDFTPTDFELKIGKGQGIPEYELQIDKEHSVSVRGFIDRVDLLSKNEDEAYVRIVDYKTGNKEFKLSEILYGINMQMLIYLRSVVENGRDYYGKKLIPTGILYMPSTTTDISGDKFTEPEKITAEMDKNFRMNGLVLNDMEVLSHMDRTGKLIKLPRKIDEGMYSDNVATMEQFNCIFKHIDETIRSMGQELYKGNVAASPLKGIKDGCAYCPYNSVCCFDYNSDYRYKEKLTAKDVYQKIKKEDKDNE
ncbi:MAG: PD-(D/E)XK nuclease family protein [Ruminococcus sp.]